MMFASFLLPERRFICSTNGPTSAGIWLLDTDDAEVRGDKDVCECVWTMLLLHEAVSTLYNVSPCFGSSVQYISRTLQSNYQINRVIFALSCFHPACMTGGMFCNELQKYLNYLGYTTVCGQ